MPDEQILTQPTLIGVLVVAVAALAGVVAYLFRRLEKRQRVLDKERDELAQERALWAVERSKWEVERSKIEGQYEAKLAIAADAYADDMRDHSENFARALRESHIENRTNEAAIRREFVEVVEQISAEAGKSADAIRAVLQKFLDRFIGPRSRGG